MPGWDRTEKMKDVTISIKGAQSSDGQEEEFFELVTDGEYSCDGGVPVFSYEESELTGYNGLMTTFKVEPERVILSRGGGINGDMIFSEKQKHHFLFETPVGPITMGIDTNGIIRNLNEDGGNLEINYVIDVDNSIVSYNSFQISIKGDNKSSGVHD